MQMRIALSHPVCAGALSAVLALVWVDGGLAPALTQTRRLAHAPRSIHFTAPESGVRIQRVDFVLEAAPPAKSDEAQKKRKTQQRSAPSAKSTRGPQVASESAAPPAPASAAADNQTSEAVPRITGQPVEPTSPVRATGLMDAGPGGAAQQSVASAASQPISAARPSRVSKDQLLALLPGSTMLRASTSGALREWVNKPDGTLTVFWNGSGLRRRPRSASGHWSVTDEGRFCLQIDWDEFPENWCRFLEQTADGKYQPVADIADANWTPPTDQTDWRPLTIRH